MVAPKLDRVNHAEFVTPFVRAGATTINFIPFAGHPEAGIDAVADVREQVLKAL